MFAVRFTAVFITMTSTRTVSS